MVTGAAASGAAAAPASSKIANTRIVNDLPAQPPLPSATRLAAGVPHASHVAGVGNMLINSLP
jgi:hypothetical protein